MVLPEAVQEFLRAHVAADRKVLVAVSGGPDSVALAHALRKLPYKCYWGHVDHQLRASSGRDARFVQRLGSSWDIPVLVSRVQVRSEARRVRRGVEETAREQRYKALAQMAQRAGCSAILTAHHADDLAETVLMNLLRGAGPAGLSGIPPARELRKGLRLLRPLLKVTREQIIAYLKSNRLSYRVDPTNEELRYSRNRMRHQTLPLLSKQYPGLADRLGQTADIFREEEHFWQHAVDMEMTKTARKNGKKITVDLRHLLGYHKALGRRILRHLLPGSSFQDIERVFNLARSPNGARRLEISGGLLVTGQNEKLVISSIGTHE